MLERLRNWIPIPEPEPPPKSPEQRRLESLLGDIGRVHPEIDTMPAGEQVTLARHLLAGLRRLRELHPDMAAAHDEIEQFAFGATKRVRVRALTAVALAHGDVEAGTVVWTSQTYAAQLSERGLVAVVP